MRFWSCSRDTGDGGAIELFIAWPSRELSDSDCEHGELSMASDVLSCKATGLGNQVLASEINYGNGDKNAINFLIDFLDCSQLIELQKKEKLKKKNFSCTTTATFGTFECASADSKED